MVGNPIMHHLVLGIDPTELGGAPFALATDEALTVAGARAGPARRTPAPASTSLPLHRRPRRRRHRRRDPVRGAARAGDREPARRRRAPTPRSSWATATGCWPRRARPGPAFEGAQISCGQRAAPGAIERVRVDRETLELRFTVIGDDRWSDEAGLRPRRHRRLRLGDHRAGRRAVPGRRDHRRGRDRRRAAARTDRVIADGRTFSYVVHEAEPRLVLTQNDVRADPAGEGRAVRRVPPVDGRLRPGDRRPDPAGGRVRRAHRPASTRWCWAWCPTATPST